MSSIKEIIDLFPGNLQDPMLQFWGIVKEELGVKREDFTELKNIVAQLAEAQKDTEKSIRQLTRTVNFTLGGLGKRWGMDSECSFRNGLIEILNETGYEVKNKLMKDTEGFVFGHPSEIEIDLVVIGKKTILVELKASVSKSDVYIFMKKAEYYSLKTGEKIDRLILITPFIDDDARIFGKENQVMICDTVTEIETRMKQA